MTSKKVQANIEDHSFCSEYLFKDWEAFLDILYEEGGCVSSILWWDHCKKNMQHESVGSGGYADPDDREWMYAETWFPDEAYAEYSYKFIDADLCERVYQLIKDCPLQTTELTRLVLQRNYPEWEGAYRDPVVLKGTAVSGDNYWKGAYGHVTARAITKHYGCTDPFAVTEMEEIAVANAASYYDMLDRVISLRTVVNTDLFMDVDMPETLWTEDTNINQKFARNNTETLDIFEPAMHNLFDTASIVIDAVLEGTL